MAQNLINERAIRKYLLGQLPSDKQERLEERLFTEPEFAEELLMVEDELFDDLVLGLLSARDREYFIARLLSVPQQRKKLELAKALRRYTSEVAPTREASSDTALPLLVSAIFDRFGYSSSFFRHFTSSFLRRFLSLRSRRKQTVIKSLNESVSVQYRDDVVWERLLSEAQTNRNLLASLIEEDWKGLSLLAQLRLSEPAREYELASKSDLSTGDIASTLARLVQCGLVDERQGELSCTALGTELLQKLEKSSGVDLI